MTINVDPQTQQLIEAAMKQRGFSTAEEVVQSAVRHMQEQVFDYDDLDEETRAAIEEGQREIDQGLGIPWEEAEARLRARFGKA
jgi:antitoxin ParD1/3/4